MIGFIHSVSMTGIIMILVTESMIGWKSISDENLELEHQLCGTESITAKWGYWPLKNWDWFEINS